MAIKPKLNWKNDGAGHRVASGFSKKWPNSYFRIWPDCGGYRVKCVNPGCESDLLGLFRTWKEAQQRCLDYVTPKPTPLSKYSKSAPGRVVCELKDKRIRLLFET